MAALPHVVSVRFSNGSGVVQEWFRCAPGPSHAMNAHPTYIQVWSKQGSHVVQEWSWRVSSEPGMLRKRNRCWRREVKVQHGCGAGEVQPWFRRSPRMRSSSVTTCTCVSRGSSVVSGVSRPWFRRGRCKAR
eukprot:6444334-Pyramimonas_sp.AAC.1